jgi:hypothetical protein
MLPNMDSLFPQSTPTRCILSLGYTATRIQPEDNVQIRDREWREKELCSRLRLRRKEDLAHARVEESNSGL